MKRLFSIVTFAIVALLSTACTTSDTTASNNNQATPAATDQAPRQRYWVTVYRVKPDLVNEYREFYQKETLPALQKAGYKQQSVYVTASLGEAFEFVIIRPIESLKEFDESSFSKALGDTGYQAWLAKRGRMIVSLHSYTMQARPDMSIAPNPNETPKLAIVTRQSIAVGRATDFENFVKTDLLPIVKKTNPKGFLMNKVGLGGDTEEYIGATLMDSFADYEKWTAALLKEGYSSILAKRAGIVMHREQAVYRYVPELSLPQPTAQQAGK